MKYKTRDIYFLCLLIDMLLLYMIKIIKELHTKHNDENTTKKIIAVYVTAFLL